MSIFQETNIDDKSSEYFRPFPNSDIYCMPRSRLEEKVRVREKESPAKTEGRSSKKSLSCSSEKGGIIPPGFIPKAWTSFKLDHDALLAIALGRANPGL